MEESGSDQTGQASLLLTTLFISKLEQCMLEFFSSQLTLIKNIVANMAYFVCPWLYLKNSRDIGFSRSLGSAPAVNATPHPHSNGK